MNEQMTQPQGNNLEPQSQKSRSMKWIGLVIVVVFAGLIAFFLFFNDMAAPKTLVSNKQAPKLTAVEEKAIFLEGGKYEAVIKIDKNGFTPSTVKIKPDTKVFWENKDSKVHKIVVSPGSKTTKYFGSGDITAGSNYYERFMDEGTYHYYDAYNSTANGTIEVLK